MANFEINRLYIPENIRVVVFDLDSTLVECIEPKVAQHLHTAKQLDLSFTATDVQTSWSKGSFTRLMNELYGQQSADAMQLIEEQYDEFPKTLYPDTLQTIKALREANIMRAILTSIKSRMVDRDFKATGLTRGHFDHLQTQEDTTKHKPDGAVFRPTKRWMISVGVNEPRDAMYVGDALEDMQAATRAGLGFVGIDRGFVSRQQFETTGALCISSLSELVIQAS